MRALFLFVLITCFCSTAFAGKVAVVPVEYVDTGSGDAIPEAAAQVEQKLVEGITEAGHEAVTGQKVSDAIQSHTVEGKCDQKCLEGAAQNLKVDELVKATVRDTDQISYAVEMKFAHADHEADERTDGFYVVLEWIKGAVALAVKDVQTGPAPEEKPEQTSEPSEKQPQPDTKPTEEKDQKGTAAIVDDDPQLEDRKQFTRRPFIISALVTTGLAITFLVLDGAAHSKYKTTENYLSISTVDDPDDYVKRVQDEIKTIENLQTAEKVFIGLTVAGAVTTGILAFFTDFKGSENQEAKSTVDIKGGVAASDKGAGFVLGGSF